MQEMNALEKQLQSWTPRRPSAKIARRLFGRTAPAPAFLGGADLWRWLTPVAACVLTLMVGLNSSSHHLPRSVTPDNATFFGTLFMNGATSNMQTTFVLSKMDENMEWNFWPHPLAAQSARWSVVPTNR